MTESILTDGTAAPSAGLEAQRLEALGRCRILDSSPEAAFDDLARLAAGVLNAPFAAISLVDDERVWFKARHGLEAAESPRAGAFCAETIRRNAPFVVEDAGGDSRFAANPLVAFAPFIKFYAGAPLADRNGFPVGTLCVMDAAPRPFDGPQLETLLLLARQACALLETRAQAAELRRESARRRRIEEAMHLLEAKFKRVFNNVVEGIFQTSPDGHYLSVNPKLASIYGYSGPEELIEAVNDISRQLYVDPNRRAEFARLLEQQDAIADFESQVFRKDGQIIWISENARAVRDGNGKLLCYEGTVEDITHRKQAEQAVVESMNLYHSLVDNVPQNIFRKDLQGRMTFANRRFCASLKLPAEEIIGKTDFDLFPPELAAKYQNDDRRVIETGETFEAVEELRTPDRGTIHVQVVKTPLYNADGRLCGIQGIFWDVTERKKMEQQLAFERDLLKALLDNVPDRIYFKDRESRFLRCSRAMAERLGLSDVEQIFNKTDFDFHPREKAQEYFEDEQRIIRTGEPMVNKVESQVAADGSVIWASVTKVPIRNQNGEITGIIGISRDITELKRAEEAAMENARLKSEFLATMSHEIRTPMNGVIGMTGLLLETALNQEQRDFAETIRTSANALLDIINDILDFSKMEAGKIQFDSVDFDLREVVESTAELLAERAQFKGVELVTFVDSQAPTALKGDPGRLRQILLNLVGNAIKFTEEGEVVVRVVCERENEAQANLHFTVTDTGIGIAPDAIGRIFQPFTQADGSTTRTYGGTGLGLAICKQIVEMMGGSIGVESQCDRGSTFWFQVRLNKQGTLITDARERPLNALEDVRVLIVDDNATNRQILEYQTAAWGMPHASVASGAEAIQKLRQQAREGRPFDLAILDMQMPLMDGLTLARKIKADPLLAPTRMVLLTSLGQKIDKAILSEAGIAVCLLKPVKQSRLYECLCMAMEEDAVHEPAFAAQLPRRATAPLKGGHHVRILVAEDNTVNRKVTLLQLRKLGLAADAVADGQEVLDALARIPYEIILMDGHMPVMDGYQATRFIRQREAQTTGTAARPVYIIAMTANALHGDREACLEAGMDDYLTKPLDLKILAESLERAVARVSASESPEAFPASSGSMPAPRREEMAPVAVEPDVLETVRRLREPGQPDPLAELIDLFLSDAPEKLEKMREAAVLGDCGTLRVASHTLKGSSSNLGAPRLASHCLALEKMARAGNLNGAAELLGRTEAEFLRVKAALEAEKLR